MSQILDLSAARHLLEQAEKAIDRLWSHIDAGDWDKAASSIAEVRSWVRTIKKDLSRAAVKSELTTLEQHALFLEKYAKDGNESMAKSNASSLKPDLQKLRTALKRLAKEQGLLEVCLDIGQVGESEAREYLEEACKCYEAGAYRAAIAMAGCALESEIRDAYSHHFGVSSGKKQYAQVLEELEKKRNLGAGEMALLETAKGFRNLSAHPSGFKATAGEAHSIIQLALEQLKKHQR